jgi:hypothetical protein
MLEALYDASWKHPVAFLAIGLVVVLALWRRAPFLLGFAFVFQIEILTDALLNSAHSPLPAAASTSVAIVFVILGDFRYFLLLERYARPRAPLAWLVRAAGLAFVVPIASVIPQRLFPETYQDLRLVFLTYEVLFAILVVGVRLTLVPRATSAPPVRAWLERLTRFELAQYGLWITADLLILAGLDAGYGLRLVPNFLYYAAFVPYAYFTAPPELWSVAPERAS